MKRCTYCGKAYPDEASECAIDRQALQTINPGPAQLSDGERKHLVDIEHLRLLSIFHYIVGIIVVCFSSLFLIHVGMGISLALHPEMWNSGKEQTSPPAFFGYFLAAFAGVFVIAGWLIGALTILSGRCIKHRKRWMFSAVMAGINCAFFPFGTALGAFTFAVLLRDSVRESYNRTQLASGFTPPAPPQ